MSTAASSLMCTWHGGNSDGRRRLDSGRRRSVRNGSGPVGGPWRRLGGQVGLPEVGAEHLVLDVPRRHAPVDESTPDRLHERQRPAEVVDGGVRELDVVEIQHARVHTVHGQDAVGAALVPDVRRPLGQRAQVVEDLVAQGEGGLVDVRVEQGDRQVRPGGGGGGENPRPRGGPPAGAGENPPAVGVIPMPALAKTTGRPESSRTTSPKGSDSVRRSPTPTVSHSRLDTSPSGLPSPRTRFTENWRCSPPSARGRLYCRGWRTPSGIGTCTVTYWPGSEVFTSRSSIRRTRNVTTPSVSWTFSAPAPTRHTVSGRTPRAL